MSIPKGCADPDACACRERIAELERAFDLSSDECVHLSQEREKEARAEERGRVANRIVGKYGTGIIGAMEIARFVRALGDE